MRFLFSLIALLSARFAFPVLIKKLFAYPSATSFISPFISDRRQAKDIIGTDSFIEIYVSTPLEECERRDVKGLYQKARDGEIPNFTGVSSPYEVPKEADITIDTSEHSLQECVDLVLKALEDRM